MTTRLVDSLRQTRSFQAQDTRVTGIVIPRCEITQLDLPILLDIGLRLNWEIDTQKISQYFTTWILKSTGLSSLGATTSDIADTLSTVGTILDISAGIVDSSSC